MTIANVALTNTFDEWRTITNQIVVKINLVAEINAITNNPFDTASNNVASANLSSRIYALANSAFAQANLSYSHANNAYNYANVVASIANAAFFAANNAVTDFSPAFNKANDAFVLANSAYTAANNAGGGYYKGNRGAVGPSTNANDIFRINANTITGNITFIAGENASATGPIILANNRTLTIDTGARVVIL